MEYVAPRSIDEAVAALGGAKGDARVLAGGTDLLVQMHAGVRRPARIVDIKYLKETRGVAEQDGAFHIGAAEASANLERNATLKAAWPGVVEAMALVGSTQIQERASLGGNLCNASPAADSVPAMIAAGAVCTVVGPDGMREVAVEDIATGPGTTSLGAGEFVAAISLAKRPPRSGDAYLRFIPRTEMDIAVVGAGVNLTLDAGGTCTAARVALGAVAPTALLVADAGAALVGTKVDDPALDAMAAAARAACRPIDDKRGTVEYRIEVAGVLARRAAAIALQRARSNLCDANM